MDTRSESTSGAIRFALYTLRESAPSISFGSFNLGLVLFFLLKPAAEPAFFMNGQQSASGACNPAVSRPRGHERTTVQSRSEKAAHKQKARFENRAFA